MSWMSPSTVPITTTPLLATCPPAARMASPRMVMPAFMASAPSMSWGRKTSMRSKASPSSRIGPAKPFSTASSRLIPAATASRAAAAASSAS